MSPYSFAANNPIMLIDHNGEGPKLPNWWISTKVWLYNSNIFWALYHSNNTSVHGLNEWAKGRAAGNEYGKLLGAVGEAIAYERLLAKDKWFYLLKSERDFGQYHNGYQIDIKQTQTTGMVKFMGVELLHQIGIRNYDAQGNQRGLKVFGSANRRETWNVLYEVKTLDPDNEVATNFGYLSKGIDQVIARGEGDKNIGVLITDKEAWMNVMNDPTYGPQLQEKFNQLEQSGNYLQLEEDLHGESQRALYGAKDEIKAEED